MSLHQLSSNMDLSISLTRFLGTHLVGRNHMVRDDGRELSVDVLLAIVDDILHNTHKIFEQALINSKLLLQHVESRKPRPYFHRSAADVSMKCAYDASCFVNEGPQPCWNPPGKRPAGCY